MAKLLVQRLLMIGKDRPHASPTARVTRPAPTRPPTFCHGPRPESSPRPVSTPSNAVPTAGDARSVADDVRPEAWRLPQADASRRPRRAVVPPSSPYGCPPDAPDVRPLAR